MIRIKTKGLEQTIRYLGRIMKTVPEAGDRTCEQLAKNTRMQARRNITMRRTKGGVIHSKGFLWQSIMAQPIKKGMWQTYIHEGVAPYARAVEMGVKGWHFKIQPGGGKWGAGVSKRGGKIPKVKGPTHFFRDATKSTERIAPQVSLRNLEEALKP